MVEFYSEILIKCAVVIFALWIGGLSTTAYGRLPNDIDIGPTHKPLCDNCGAEIKFKYFFPILGYILSRGKCINCKKPIPKVYLWLEIAVATYIILMSFQYKIIDEKFISKALCGAYLIVLLFVYQTHKRIKSRLVWMLTTFLLIYKGYNGILPSVIELFVCSAFAYMTFYLYSKKIKVEKTEFIMSTILVMSMGEIVASIFLLSAICFWMLFIRKNNKQKNIHLQQQHIVIVPLITALLLMFIA